jgi:2-polyprenyl-6-methoxyphenol hydroxylase-like FAD-dependent oxidoreductase
MSDRVSSRAVDADVIVVGAGPVGLVLSLLLTAQGHRVTLIERWDSPYPLPRAVAASHDVRRILSLLDLGAELDGLFEAWGEDGQRIVFEDAAGETLIQTQFELSSVSGHPEMSGFSQPELERLLDTRVSSDRLIDVRRNTSLIGLKMCEGYVSVTLEPHDGLAPIPGGRRSVISGTYLVGCDGTNSTVRGLTDLEINDLGFDREWFVVDVSLTPEAPPTPYAAQHLDPGRPTTIAPAGPGRKRWEFMVMPSDDPDTVDTDEKAWELLEPWGVNSQTARLVRHAQYVFRARLAEQWQSGRVMLAGDAAHQMPPFLGQGLNSGIRDAANLAWRLDLLLNGSARFAGTTLLSDYELERKSHVRQIVEETVHIGEMICITDPDKARDRDSRLRRRASEVRKSKTTWETNGGTLTRSALS